LNVRHVVYVPESVRVGEFEPMLERGVVDVRIEVNDVQRLGIRPHDREANRMVSAQDDRERTAGENLLHGACDVGERVFDVGGQDIHVPDIYDPAFLLFTLQELLLASVIVVPLGTESQRMLSNAPRPQAGPGQKWGTLICGGPDNCDVGV